MPENDAALGLIGILLPVVIGASVLAVAGFRIWTYRRLNSIAKRGDTRYGETVTMYAQSAERHDKMIALLTEIRDRLPRPPAV